MFVRSFVDSSLVSSYGADRTRREGNSFLLRVDFRGSCAVSLLDVVWIPIDEIYFGRVQVVWIAEVCLKKRKNSCEIIGEGTIYRKPDARLTQEL